MAKQIGPFKFRDKLDDVCGRQTADGIILQAKPGPSREQVLNHSRFTNTRRNAHEFGGAVAASTLLRRVLGYMGRSVKHAKLVSHMNKKLHAVVQSDTASAWGERHVNKGNIHLLEGFDYNHLLGLDTALPVELVHTLDASTGRMQLTVPGSLVRRKRVFPKQATHFRIVSCAGAVNFDKNRYSFDMAESELLPLGKTMEALQLEHRQPAQVGDMMLHTVGMVFYEVIDGVAHMLRGGALQIVEVARVQEVVCETVADTMRGVTDDAVAAEADHFSVGVTDAKGVPLQGPVVFEDKRSNKKRPRVLTVATSHKIELRDCKSRRAKVPQSEEAGE